MGALTSRVVASAAPLGLQHSHVHAHVTCACVHVHVMCACACVTILLVNVFKVLSIDPGCAIEPKLCRNGPTLVKVNLKAVL